MATSLTFGDVFQHREKMYVYLAKTPEAIYVAEILNHEHARLIQELHNKALTRGGVHPRVLENVLYCYVILETENVRDRMAHFNNPGRNDVQINIESLICALNESDRKVIKEEILNNKSAIPKILKELVKDLDINH